MLHSRDHKLVVERPIRFASSFDGFSIPQIERLVDSRIMAIVFQIPRILHQYSEGQGEFQLDGPTVAAALRQLNRDYPEVYRCVCDETGSVRRHIKVFVNERMLFGREDFDAPLESGDVVSVFQSVSGG